MTDCGESMRGCGSAIGREWCCCHVGWRKERLMQEFAVECKGAEHDAVHEHPAHEGRGGAFVEAGYAFFADGEEEAL